jgi:ribonuclease-3
VSTQALAQFGERLALGEHLLLGRGEEKTGGRRKQALIANTFEALIAAVYLDGGIDAARVFIERQFRDAIEEAGTTGEVSGVIADYKSALQERLQSRNLPLPEYRLVAERGPDHRKSFRVEVWVAGEAMSAAEGRSKKEAEQLAAQQALERMSG